MSFLNKMKSWGGKNEPDAAQQDNPFEDAFAQPAPDLPSPDGAATLDAMDVSTVQHTAGPDSSIITEAAPSEMADFGETRIQGADAAAGAASSGLPLIGRQPVAQQQRILAFMVGIGLIGLVGMTISSLISANRGAAQVGA